MKDVKKLLWTNIKDSWWWKIVLAIVIYSSLLYFIWSLISFPWLFYPCSLVLLVSIIFVVLYLYDARSNKKSLEYSISFGVLVIVLIVCWVLFQKITSSNILNTSLTKYLSLSVSFIAVLGLILNKLIETLLDFSIKDGPLLKQKSFEKLFKIMLIFLSATLPVIFVIEKESKDMVVDVLLDESSNRMRPEFCFPTNTNDPVLSGVFTEMEGREELISGYYCNSTFGWEGLFFNYINNSPRKEIEARKFWDKDLKTVDIVRCNPINGALPWFSK